jgi:uncharacterized protein (TIGR02246 family)
MAEGADSIADDLIGRLERAWNEAGGRAFGEPFTADADFVDIRGEHHRGREAIAGGHQAIFDSVYKGSSTDYELIGARKLSDDVIPAHATGALKAPSPASTAWCKPWSWFEVATGGRSPVFTTRSWRRSDDRGYGLPYELPETRAGLPAINRVVAAKMRASPVPGRRS